MERRLVPARFFFSSRGRHTRCSRDWSSDVCSSDLVPSPRVTFLNFLASHDGIGVAPAAGILTPAELDNLVALAQRRGGSVSYRRNHDGTTRDRKSVV